MPLVRDLISMGVGVLLGGALIGGAFAWDELKGPGEAVETTWAGEKLAGAAEHERAAVLFRKALQLDPDQHDAKLLLGKSLCSLGRYAEGLQQLKGLLEISPGWSPAHMALVDCHVQKNKLAAAIEGLRTHLRLVDEQNGWPMKRLRELSAGAASIAQTLPFDMAWAGKPLRLVSGGSSAACSKDEVLVGGGCGAQGTRLACIQMNSSRHGCEGAAQPGCRGGAWHCPAEAGGVELVAPAFALCIGSEALR